MDVKMTNLVSTKLLTNKQSAEIDFNDTVSWDNYTSADEKASMIVNSIRNLEQTMADMNLWENYVTQLQSQQKTEEGTDNNNN